MATKPFPKALKQFLLLLAGALIVIAFYVGGMSALRRSTRLNFEVVDKGRLLRTAQPRPGDLDRIHRAEGIGTIISLRGSEEIEVKEWAQKHDVALLSMKMKADDPPTDGQIGLFFDIMRGESVNVDVYQDVIAQRGGMQKSKVFTFPFPVLLHCEGGSDRTGVLVALYRMAFQGWGVDLAQRDMTARFHLTSMHPRQFQFLEEVADRINPTYGTRSPRLKFPTVPPSESQPAPGATAPAAGSTGDH